MLDTHTLFNFELAVLLLPSHQIDRSIALDGIFCFDGQIGDVLNVVEVIAQSFVH
jgi:hypothetical protein